MESPQHTSYNVNTIYRVSIDIIISPRGITCEIMKFYCGIKNP